MKILLVEDDKTLSSTIKETLESQTFAVDLVSTIDAAQFQIEEFTKEYDCIVLDINLPDGNGFDLCKDIRNKKITTPIIMMTARDTLEEKIKGLNIGADDYITKPFSIQELIARIKSIIRRSSKEPLPIITVGRLEVNPQTMRVLNNKKPNIHKQCHPHLNK